MGKEDHKINFPGVVAAVIAKQFQGTAESYLHLCKFFEEDGPAGRLKFRPNELRLSGETSAGHVDVLDENTDEYIRLNTTDVLARDMDGTYYVRFCLPR